MSGIKRAVLSLFCVVISFIFTGCGDLVEIQDRDFVMALGISYQNGQYQVTYSLPNLSEITDQATAGQNNLLRTYEGNSLAEAEQIYNANSENRLDYRHLQTIIIDATICENEQAMKELLLQIDDKYDISHNVLVYFSRVELTDIMGMESINGSIGEHLKKLNSNNYVGGME